MYFQIEDDTQLLKRHGSSMSIQSNTLSVHSGSSLKTSRNLREKVHEVETFRDILFDQINSLQKFFDACAVQSSSFQETLNAESGLNTLDFKGEAITFRETTAGVIETLNSCLDIIVQKEESVKKKLDCEIEKRRKVEEELKACQEKMVKIKMSSSGPDMEEEGPNSSIPEDEFFDAVETGLEKIEEVRQIRVKLKLQNQQSQIEAGQIAEEDVEIEVDEFGTGNLAKYHVLWPDIHRVCEEQLKHALSGVSEGSWQIFADEGEMKMYRREEEIDGMVVDPLKSVHVVQGCTAREMCHYFFDPKYRNDWETTLEECNILESIAPDTLVFLQTHKRIWPANQRDALFWSHMK
jgi:collagen type IV alpha-3-binding protein